MVRASGGNKTSTARESGTPAMDKVPSWGRKNGGSAVDEASLGRKGGCRQGEATDGGDLLSRNKKTGCLLESARWVEFTTGLKMEVFCGADAKEESLYPSL